MKKIKPGVMSAILSPLFAIYIIVLLKITVFRDGYSNNRSVNLVPFKTISEYWKFVLTGNRFIGFSNLFGNFFMFVPFGFLAALVFPKMRKLTKVLLLSFIFSIVIEIFQYVFSCGTADIDDVILNIAGAAAGYGVYIFFPGLYRAKKCTALFSIFMIAATCIGFNSFKSYKFLLPNPNSLPQTEIDYFSNHPGNNEGANDAAALHSDSNDMNPKKSARTKWYLILVNKWNPIPNGYEPDVAKLANGQSVDKRIYPALQKMLDDARNNGLHLFVASGYRSAAEQQHQLEKKIAAFIAEGYSAKEAAAKSEEWVSIPGTSEHQIGLAVDINADGVYSTSDEVYDHLYKNAYKYGFILRYPPGKSKITGISYEPWHYRYVGVKAATDIHNRSICLEEYLMYEQ